MSYRKRGNSFLRLFGSFFSAPCFCPHARARSLARTHARPLSLLLPSSHSQRRRCRCCCSAGAERRGPQRALFCSFGVLLGVFGVLCFGWLVVGIHLVFDGTARLPFFWWRGEVWIFVLFCFRVCVVFCWFLSGLVRMMSMVDVNEDPGLVPLYSLLGEDSAGVGGKCVVVVVVIV